MVLPPGGAPQLMVPMAAAEVHGRDDEDEDEEDEKEEEEEKEEDEAEA